MRALFTNAGRRTYLMEFALALAQSGYPVEFFASDCDPYAPALHVSDRIGRIMTPPLSRGEVAYADSLLNLARACGIDVIIPLSDLDLEVLAAHRGRFADAGITVVVGDVTAVSRCVDKRQMDAFCRAAGLPVPRTAFNADANLGFPCVVKDIRGSGSSGLRIVRDAADLAAFVEGRSMIQELVVGAEYGVDALNDLDGRPVAVCVKRKMLMRAGETDRSEVIHAPKVAALATAVATALGHVGNLDIDIIEGEKGDLFCLDFNPRFGGGYPATHLAGFDFLKAVLDMCAGRTATLAAAPRRIVVMKGISLFSCEPVS